MRKYTAKTLEECLKEAAADLQVEEKDIKYVIEEEKKGLFVKKVTIAVEETSDVIEFIEEYIKDICRNLGMDCSVKTFYRDDVIKVLLETNKNSVLIGKNGACLQSLNELTKLAVSSNFSKKYKILLDVGGYKDKKYFKVISIAKRCAKEVLKTHIDVKLDPMTPDERKKIHNALSTWKNIKTESVGDGKLRAIVIKYAPQEGNEEPQEEVETEE
ncbi:MAG: KH domain-containing protein [Bacilli bacterium]|nr:KH domain-containing protein [Bacilli bacterium]